MYNAIVKNWRSTLMGLLSGLVTGMIVGYTNGQFQLNWKSAGTFAVFTLWGMIQKDFNISNAPQPTAVGNKLPDYVQNPLPPTVAAPGPYSGT